MGEPDNHQPFTLAVAKFVAGPMEWTAGPTTGTVKGYRKENYRLWSDDRDRAVGFQPSSSPITGTHIVYHVRGEVDGPLREPDAEICSLS
jgi:hypothetical protein